MFAKTVRGYVYFRAALASLIGFAILAAGLFQNRTSGAGRDFIWFLLVFIAFQAVAFRWYRATRTATTAAQTADLLERHAARRDAQRAASAPVVGKACAECDKRIVVLHDGSRCETCSTPLHHKCRDGHMRKQHPPEDEPYR